MTFCETHETSFKKCVNIIRSVKTMGIDDTDERCVWLNGDNNNMMVECCNDERRRKMIDDKSYKLLRVFLYFFLYSCLFLFECICISNSLISLISYLACGCLFSTLQIYLKHTCCYIFIYIKRSIQADP